MIRLFKWRTRCEPAAVGCSAVVGSDVGIVAMRTFIEMTADSKKFRLFWLSSLCLILV